MANKPLIDIAYDVLKQSSSPLAFKDLFELSLKASGLEVTEDRKLDLISPFYTQLTIDRRFVIFTGNVWDLKERNKFESIKTAAENDDTEKADNREEAAELEEERKEEFGEDLDEGDDEDGSSKEEDSVEIDEPNL